MRDFQVFFIYIFAFALYHCQILKYYCSFDTDVGNDCVFNETTGDKPLRTQMGVEPTNSTPVQPLSDVKSILSLTIPNDESCILPYEYSLGTWTMYFCKYINPSRYTCPTESGTGQCVTGRYGFVIANYGSVNHTYSTKIETMSNTVHCLDFYYYLTDMLDDAKISVGWTADDMTETIVEVTAQEENKWQRNRVNFTSPSSESYHLWFSMTRTSEEFRSFTFALDEIKISGNSREYASTVMPTAADTREISIDYSQMTTVTVTVTSLSSNNESQTITIEYLESNATTNITTGTTTTDPTTDDRKTETTLRGTSTLDILVTTTTRKINTTSASSVKINFSLILGLSLGLGIPLIGFIAGLISRFCCYQQDRSQCCRHQPDPNIQHRVITPVDYAENYYKNDYINMSFDAGDM